MKINKERKKESCLYIFFAIYITTSHYVHSQKNHHRVCLEKLSSEH